MDAKTDDDERATGRVVEDAMRCAIASLRTISTTGNKNLDADILLAEKAIRRVMIAAQNDPD